VEQPFINVMRISPFVQQVPNDVHRDNVILTRCLLRIRKFKVIHIIATLTCRCDCIYSNQRTTIIVRHWLKTVVFLGVAPCSLAGSVGDHPDDEGSQVL
jgi:hypothetical protein